MKVREASIRSGHHQTVTGDVNTIAAPGVLVVDCLIVGAWRCKTTHTEHHVWEWKSQTSEVLRQNARVSLPISFSV
jgi:hypothetical protein